MKQHAKDFRVREGADINLKKWPTVVQPYYDSKKHYKTILRERVEKLSDLQSILYAADSYALLLIFQAMDAAGKDSAIKHVMSGVNPQGCQVFSFKHPSLHELDHDFLWRTNQCLPERGRIGIFNRSYYEEVLIVRVHPELLQSQRIPNGAQDAKNRSGQGATARSVIWKHTCTATAPESSSFFFTCPKKSSANASSPASMSRIRIGSSAWTI